MGRISSDGSTTTAVLPYIDGASAHSTSHTVVSTGKLMLKEHIKEKGQQQQYCSTKQPQTAVPAKSQQLHTRTRQEMR